MTRRDPDAIIAAWLDLMPDETRDRVIAMTLQVVATTEQTHRVPPVPFIGRPLGRVAVLAVVTAGLVGIVGATLLGAGSWSAIRPGPTATPSASAPAAVIDPSTAAGTVPEALRSTWLGGPRTVAGAQDPDDAYLSFDESSMRFATRYGNAQTYWFDGAASGVDRNLDVATTTSGLGCAARDEGAYRWALSPGGTMLTLAVVRDACAGRAAALPGEWYRMACTNEVTWCGGDLEAGTYRSWNLALDLADDGTWHPPFGALTYHVPAGWTNSNDFGAGYWLEPTTWHQKLLAEKGGKDDTGRWATTGIYVLARPLAEQQDDQCLGRPDDSIESTAAALTDFIAQHPGLRVIDRRPIEIGTLSGTMLDVEMAADWDRRCPGDPGPVVSVLTAAEGAPSTGEYDWGTVRGAKDRYIVLDLGDGRPVVVVVSARDPTEFDAFAADAMSVVQSFRFLP